MKSIFNYFKRLNPALPELIVTIVIYGLLILIAGVCFFESAQRYMIGLAFGIGQAIFLSINMASSILGAVEVKDKKGQTVVAIKAISRYFIVVITTFAMCYWKLGYIGTWFVGVMGLKVAALSQPLIHRVLGHILHK